ncbi:MAG: NADH-ubiquinone oxidoreductase subunit E family protein [Campylobacter sp.]
MKRVDLRHLKSDFLDELQNDLSRLSRGEVCIYLFEIGEFDNIEKSIDLVLKSDCELMNSLKFNQVDWTIAVKRN